MSISIQSFRGPPRIGELGASSPERTRPPATVALPEADTPAAPVPAPALTNEQMTKLRLAGTAQALRRLIGGENI